jgi:hypothetical protein
MEKRKNKPGETLLKSQKISSSILQEWIDYLEFIARVRSHILEKAQVMVCYFGLYANAHRGKACSPKNETSIPDFRNVEILNPLLRRIH